jgi:hypothetical protein
MSKKFDIWGHATSSKEKAEDILKNGLYTKWKALHDVAYELSNNRDNLRKKLSGWDYQAYSNIILIAVPKGFQSTDFGGYEVRMESIENSDEHVFVEAVHQGSEYIPKGKYKKISSSIIAGFIDNTDFSLFVNENFDLD